MAENKIREPIQKRSIEKKEKILKVGFDLICEKGYYNVSTPDIAKAAGVSTGIVYSYFKDKKDIFVEGIKKYSNSIFFPMLDILTITSVKKNNLKAVLKQLINVFIENHTLSSSAHEEILAMSHTDKEVAQFFIDFEIEITEQIVKILKNNNFKTKHLTEKVHISMGLVENLCHEIVFHKHSNINESAMKNEVIDIIINLLKE